METFTRTLAMEWADWNVRVNCVRSGLIATPNVAENRGVDLSDVDLSRADRTIGDPPRSPT